MWKMIKNGFGLGFGGALGWSLGQWVAGLVKRFIILMLSLSMVFCAGYGQHVSQKMAIQKQNQSVGVKHESQANKK